MSQNKESILEKSLKVGLSGSSAYGYTSHFFNVVKNYNELSI